MKPLLMFVEQRYAERGRPGGTRKQAPVVDTTAVTRVSPIVTRKNGPDNKESAACCCAHFKEPLPNNCTLGHHQKTANYQTAMKRAS